MIHFPTRTTNRTVTIELPPSSTTRRHTRALIAVVESLILRDYARIVLDLRRTAKLGSESVQAIAFLHATARSRGRLLQLDNVSTQVWRALERVDPRCLPAISPQRERANPTPSPRRWSRARAVHPVYPPKSHASAS